MGDTHLVRILPGLLFVALTTGACAGSGDATTVTANPPTNPPTTPPTTPPLVTTTSPATPETTPPASVNEDPPVTDVTTPETTAAVTTGPSYDVFLAAVAESVVGTRFEGAPFDDPEIFTATGLLMCERVTAGFGPDEVILEYLTELTGGRPAGADDDQLVLAGALFGAAEVALCPASE